MLEKRHRRFVVYAERRTPSIAATVGARPLESFFAFTSELRVVATPKPYPENDCPGCGQDGEEVWELVVSPGIFQHHRPSHLFCLKFVSPDQAESCYGAKFSGPPSLSPLSAE
jgi:hypothetical protein